MIRFDKEIDMRAEETGTNARAEAFLNERMLERLSANTNKRESAPELLDGTQKMIRETGEILGRILVVMKGEASEPPYSENAGSFMEALQTTEKQAMALKRMAEELNEMF